MVVKFPFMDALFVIAIVAGICCALRYPMFWLAVLAILATKLLGLTEDKLPTVFIIIGAFIGAALVAGVWNKTKRAFAEGKGEDEPKA